MQTTWKLTDGNWFSVRDGDARARGLYRRHYSFDHLTDGRRPAKIIGPGEYLMFQTVDSRALFAWRKFIDRSGEQGVNCAIFRNEGPILSSLLIQEADELAWVRWPGERHYTYVNPKRIRSTNPGYCFMMAGWRRCDHRTKSGLIVLERLPASP